MAIQPVVRRTQEEIYGSRLVTYYSRIPGAMQAIPMPNVYVVRDDWHGRYHISPWGVRVHMPLNSRGFVFNLGVIHDVSTVSEIIFRPEEGTPADIRGVPGYVGLHIFYGLSMTEETRRRVYRGDKSVLGSAVREPENTTTSRLRDRIIDTITKFGETEQGLTEAVNGLRTDIRTLVRKHANGLSLTEATETLKQRVHEELTGLNPDFERRWNIHVLDIAVEPSYTESVLHELEEVYGNVQATIARRRVAELMAQTDRTMLDTLKAAGLEGDALANAYVAYKDAEGRVEASQNLAEGKAPLIVDTGKK